jgi:hypothetical protein
MNTPTIDEMRGKIGDDELRHEFPVMTRRSTEKPNMTEMRQDVCDLARDLMQRAGSPLDVVEALIAGTIDFAGRIGEDAMRKHVSNMMQLDQLEREDRFLKSCKEDQTKHDDRPF